MGNPDSHDGQGCQEKQARGGNRRKEANDGKGSRLDLAQQSAVAVCPGPCPTEQAPEGCLGLCVQWNKIRGTKMRLDYKKGTDEPFDHQESPPGDRTTDSR